MTKRILEASPRSRARIAGVFYSVIILAGFFALFVLGRLVVTGDAPAAAARIVAHEPLFRLSFAAELVAITCYIAVTVLFHGWFKRVDRSLALIAAYLSLLGCAVGALTLVFHLTPGTLLEGVQYLSAFAVEQLETLALVLLKLRARVANSGTVLVGFYCLLIGYLIASLTLWLLVVGVNVQRWKEAAGPGGGMAVEGPPITK